MNSQEIKSESLGEEVHGVHDELNDEISEIWINAYLKSLDTRKM